MPPRRERKRKEPIHWRFVRMSCCKRIFGFGKNALAGVDTKRCPECQKEAAFMLIEEKEENG